MFFIAKSLASSQILSAVQAKLDTANESDFGFLDLETELGNMGFETKFNGRKRELTISVATDTIIIGEAE